MRYTLRQIEYFIATAELGSITLASDRINISQPSISTAITQLEAELGAQLFLRRHAQGLSLTPAGRHLLVEAKQLIDQAHRLYDTASEVSDSLRGTLSLGCLVTFAPMVLPEIAQGFARDHAGVRIVPDVDQQDALLRKLERAELDLALSYDLSLPDGFEFTPLAELPPHALMAETNPLAADETVSLETLCDQDLILLDLPLSRDYFLGLFSRHGLIPRIGARLQHTDVIRAMVANGFGYTIANVRPRATRALDGRQVVRLRIAGDSMPMRLGLLRMARQRPTRLISAFIEYCGARISNGYIPGMDAPLPEARRLDPA